MDVGKIGIGEQGDTIQRQRGRRARADKIAVRVDKQQADIRCSGEHHDEVAGTIEGHVLDIGDGVRDKAGHEPGAVTEAGVELAVCGQPDHGDRPGKACILRHSGQIDPALPVYQDAAQRVIADVDKRNASGSKALIQQAIGRVAHHYEIGWIGAYPGRPGHQQASLIVESRATIALERASARDVEPGKTDTCRIAGVEVAIGVVLGNDEIAIARIGPPGREDIALCVDEQVAGSIRLDDVGRNLAVPAEARVETSIRRELDDVEVGSVRASDQQIPVRIECNRRSRLGGGAAKPVISVPAEAGVRRSILVETHDYKVLRAC